jgi:tubulin polyglutamylase TTLL6/13
MELSRNKDRQSDNLYDEYDEVTDEGDNDDEYFSATDGCDSDGNKKPIRINMYCKYTHYEIIKEVGKNVCEFHLTKKSRSDWDIAWFDGPSPAYLINLIKNMSVHQRTNHYPGINNLARKNMLGRHLMKMKKLLSNDYNFFPQTYMLPHDYKDFREDSQQGNVAYIVKPEDSCQGKGIYITRQWEQIKNTDQMVVQRYMLKPHLIDSFKYDLRIYVLVNGINPLRMYVYKDGLARFATEPYQKPNEKNCNNLFMHLTNYAINKESENFIEGDGLRDDQGSKRSYQSILDNIAETHGYKAMIKVQQGINDILIKCMCMVQPHVNHLVKSSQPDDIENQMIF